MTYYMLLMFYYFTGVLSNLYVLQDPSILDWKFLIYEMYEFNPYTNLSKMLTNLSLVLNTCKLFCIYFTNLSKRKCKRICR